MGYRVSLVAVKGRPAAEIQRVVGVAPTGRFEEIAEDPVSGLTLPGGVCVLYLNRPPLADATLAALSAGAEVLVLSVNETFMASEVAGWSGGARVWSVSHDAQRGIEHLQTDGEIPEPFPAIRSRLLAEQAGETGVDHVFDVPVELFVALGGVRHDCDVPGAVPEPWEVLEATR